jgi:hypothetical protein
MSPVINDKDIEDIIAKYEGLVSRREALSQGVVKVETVLTERRRALKKVMDEAIAAGIDPNKVQEELQRLREVLDLKVNNFAVELEAGENLLRPMLKEVREGS